MKRNTKGAVIGLVAACGFVLAIVVTGFFFLSTVIGGAREVHNATDAGALNLGKEIFTNENFKVKRENSSFADLADKNGEFGLANINSVWGKALLLAANAEAMQETGLAGRSRENSDRIFSEAKSISEELARKLNTERSQYELFESLAGQNSVRMLGLESKAVAARESDCWQTALLSRGQASNVEVNAQEIMPSNSSYDALHIKEGFIPGYTPLAIGGKVFAFVSFPEKERVHLVSQEEFNQNTATAKPLAGPEWGAAVPNGFSCKGKSLNQFELSQTALACVFANPQRKYKLSIPHSFLKIKLARNRANWLFNSPDPRINGFNIGLVEKNGSYTNRLDPTNLAGGKGSAVDGELRGSFVPLGREFTESPSLDTALFGSERENGNKERLESVLVQRINQMLSKPGSRFNKEDLHNLLRSNATAIGMQAGGDQSYYIFSANGSDVEVAQRQEAIARAPWLQNIIDNEPDGDISDGFCSLASSLILPPGIVLVNPLPGGNIVVPPFGRLAVDIQDDWTPGSGFQGCLGQVVSSHKSKVYLWGIAIIPAAPGAGLLDLLF